MQSMQSTTRNLAAVTSKINEGEGSVGALINDRTMYQQATAGVTAFQENMEAMKHNFLLRGFFKSRATETQNLDAAFGTLPGKFRLRRIEDLHKGRFSEAPE